MFYCWSSSSCLVFEINSSTGPLPSTGFIQRHTTFKITQAKRLFKNDICSGRYPLLTSFWTIVSFLHQFRQPFCDLAFQIYICCVEFPWYMFSWFCMFSSYFCCFEAISESRIRNSYLTASCDNYIFLKHFIKWKHSLWKWGTSQTLACLNLPVWWAQ